MAPAEIDDDAAGDAARHLYWSRSRSNAPPSPKTLDEAKASRSDATKSEKEWTPIFKWGQKKDRIVLTIFVPCLEKDAATVDVKPRALTFRAEKKRLLSELENRLNLISARSKQAGKVVRLSAAA